MFFCNHWLFYSLIIIDVTLLFGLDYFEFWLNNWFSNNRFVFLDIIFIIYEINFELFLFNYGFNNRLVDIFSRIQRIFSDSNFLFRLNIFNNCIQNFFFFRCSSYVEDFLDFVDLWFNNSLNHSLITLNINIFRNFLRSILNWERLFFNINFLFFSLKYWNEFLNSLIDLRLNNDSLSERFEKLFLNNFWFSHDSFSNNLRIGGVSFGDYFWLDGKFLFSDTISLQVIECQLLIGRTLCCGGCGGLGDFFW